MDGGAVMRNGKSKAERKKARKISLPGGVEIAQRPTGRDRTHTNAPEDARRTALQARCRIAGVMDTPETRRALSAPLMGSDVGRCIAAIHQDEARRAESWSVWQAVCSARLAYRQRILGVTGQPQGAAIAMLPDQMQTDQSHSVDLRTADERDAAAKRANEYWASLIAALPTPQHKWALRPAMDEVEGALWRDGEPTARGRVCVAALVLLAAMHTTR